MAQEVVADHDWRRVEADYQASSPFNYAVIDNFLLPEACAHLREELIGHWGWKKANWVSEHLHNNRPPLPEVDEIAAILKDRVPSLLSDKQLVSHWALMYTTNQPGGVHADNAGVTLTLWLTPDEFNRDPNCGGLVMHDVKRDPELMVHEFLGRAWAEPYVREKTRGYKVHIPYAYNRAILFDGRTFHQTDRLAFTCSGPDAFRINFAMAFENAEADAERLKPYRLHAPANGAP